jgi:hypothetical protein
VTFVDSLHPLVITGDAVGARDLLAGLEGRELSEARAWFAKATRWLGQFTTHDFAPSDDPNLQWAHHVESSRIMALCAVELCGPVTAAKRVPWDQFWEHQHTVGDQLFLDAVCAKDPEWVADFVEAASHRFGRTLSWVLRAINAKVPVPCPTGSEYVPGWVGYHPPEELADEMAADPWMPDALFHILDFGWAASWDNLPGAIAVLTSTGRLDRSRVVSHILGLLTSPQKPGSQQALVRILAALELSDDELPGIDYVLGVMATSSGAVGKYLLPAALRLVATSDDLIQLTSVLAGRREKWQKQQLLVALEGTLRDRLGDEAVAEALVVLSADDDAAFASNVAAALRELGTSVESVAQPDSLGLWDLEPMPLPEENRPSWEKWGHASWAHLLSTEEPAEPLMHDVMVSQLLVSLSEGATNAVAGFRDPVLSVWSMGRLGLSRLSAALSDLFLAGALRQLWPVALELADRDACGATQTAGFADFLRMLARFAPEVPAQPVPGGLALLAARKGASKAQMEARVLGAALSGTDPDSFTAHVRANPPVEAPRVERGLWRATAPDARADRKLVALQDPDIAALLTIPGERYDRQHNPLCYYPRDHPKAKGHAWLAELLLEETVRMVGEVGPDGLRARLVDIRRKTPPVPVVLAIDLWASGNLTPEFFWRLATNPCSPRYTSWETPSPWGRVGDCPWFDRVLGQDPDMPIVMPYSIEWSTGRLPFLRACELLLVAERSPVMLSTPVYFDGTLDLDALIARLDRVQGPVALLDVIQALYRLRRCDPARASEIALDRWWTDPVLTTKAGHEPVDAGGVIREWILAGGMPSAPPPGRSAVQAMSDASPVPWSIAESARQSIGTPSRGGLDCLRLMPLVPDLALPIHTGEVWERLPLNSHRPWGERMHDTAMDLLAEPALKEGVDWLPLVRKLVQTEMLEPALAGRRGVISGLPYGFERLFENGGLAGGWPISLACATVSLTIDPKDVAVGRFLAFLARYAHEVPDPEVPQELRTFAGEPGNDAVRTQARLLVAALERP